MRSRVRRPFTLKNLEEVLVEALCFGPLNEAADRARRNCENYIGYHMLRKQRIIMWILVGLCLTQCCSLILFFKFLYGRGN
jgi:hypothetical protein